MILLGKLTVGGKTFTAQDSIGKVSREQLGLTDDFYGGNVKNFYKTKEGFLLCLDSRDNIINLGYMEGQLTEELEKVDRKELLEKAKQLGIEGKLATFKTSELIEKIRERAEHDPE